MNKTSDILTKQYIKLCNERDLLTKECDDLPVGSIQQKKIKNGVYFYRQYREGTTDRNNQNREKSLETRQNRDFLGFLMLLLPRII